MKNRIKKLISEWTDKGYKNGLPDEAPLRLEQLNKVLSHRMIVKAILKNDYSSIGIYKQKCEAYSNIKRIEIAMRNHEKI